MSDRMQAKFPVLKRLVRAKRPKRTEILREADSELIKCICECAINVLDSTVPLTDRQHTCLAKHKAFLRELADRKVSLQSKKLKLEQQTGGFLLGLLRPVVESYLADLLEST
jgi:hypothetical protein